MKPSTDDLSDLRQHSIQGIPVGQQKIQIGSIDEFLRKELLGRELPIAVTIKYDLRENELINVFVRRPARYKSPMGPTIELWCSLFPSHKKQKKTQEEGSIGVLMQPLLGDEEEKEANAEETNLQVEGFDRTVQKASESDKRYTAVEATLWCRAHTFGVKCTGPKPNGSPMHHSVIAIRKWARKMFDIADPSSSLDDPFEDAPERDYV